MTSAGIAFCPAVLDLSQVEVWLARIDQLYSTISDLGKVVENLPPGQRFAPTASSFTLGAVFSEPELQSMISAVCAGPAGRSMFPSLGEKLACDLSQSWIRRQYAPRNYPALHAPHGWHQDGALKFDFLAFPSGVFPPDAVLTMATCWIALNPCGEHAPGLEIVSCPLTTLLPPADLADDRVRAQFAPDEFFRPLFQTGDAVVMRGSVLHRTFVTPLMTRDRTSLELRFFAANQVPPRLQSDQFLTA